MCETVAGNGKLKEKIIRIGQSAGKTPIKWRILRDYTPDFLTNNRDYVKIS
jgi:hypothetical protein